MENQQGSIVFVHNFVINISAFFASLFCIAFLGKSISSVHFLCAFFVYESLTICPSTHRCFIHIFVDLYCI